jgi:UDP-glucose 4-epimerase
VVLLSSGGAVYGPPATAPFSEADDPHPANEYGRIKFAEERLLADEGVAHTVLRIANPYGPAQVSGAARTVGGQGVVGHWLASIRIGAPVTVYGDGSAVRDYVYVKDVAAAVATAAERRPGGVINIGSGTGTSLAELLDVVTKAVAPHPVTVHREPPRDVDPAAAWLSVDKARELLGWSATTGLAEGIALTWESVRR